MLTAIDFIANMFLLGERMTAEANAFKEGLGDAMAAMSGSQIAGFVIMNHVLWLVNLVLATMAGAMMYSEDSAAG